jgi:hypothetical protein
MPFSFGGPDMPMSLRWTRSLVYSEVVLLVFVVLFYVVFEVLGLTTTPGVKATGTASTGSTVVALVVVLALALGLTYLAIDLRNKRNGTRVAIAVIQLAMLIFGIVTSLNSPVAIALTVLLTGGALYSLYAPSSNAAFAAAAAGVGAKPTEPEFPEELKKIFSEAQAKKAESAAPSEESKSAEDKTEVDGADEDKSES